MTWQSDTIDFPLGDLDVTVDFQWQHVGAVGGGNDTAEPSDLTVNLLSVHVDGDLLSHLDGTALLQTCQGRAEDAAAKARLGDMLADRHGDDK